MSDFFTPAKGAANAETGFHRTLKLHSARATKDVWFRAAVGEKITDLGKDTYLVDDSVRLAFPRSLREVASNLATPTHKIMIRSSEGKFELLVPVIFESGKAEVTEEISW